MVNKMLSPALLHSLQYVVKSDRKGVNLTVYLTPKFASHLHRYKSKISWRREVEGEGEQWEGKREGWEGTGHEGSG